MRLAGLRAGLSLRLSGAREEIEHAAAVGARAPSGDPAQQLAVVDVHLHDRIQGLTQLAQQSVQRARLGEVAGKAVEDKAPPGRSEERRVGKECRSRWSP